MAKNRKKPSTAARFAPAIKAVMLCLLLGGSGIGYVRQKNEIFALTEKYKRGEVELERLRSQNQVRARSLESLQSPRVLEAKAKALNLGLVPPRPDQIVRLSEMPSGLPLAGGEKLLAGNETGAGLAKP